MSALQHWSLGRVLLVSSVWIFVSLAAPVVWLEFQMQIMAASGSGGIFASAGYVDIYGVTVLGPPAVLIVAWLLARRRRPPKPDSGRDHPLSGSI